MAIPGHTFPAPRYPSCTHTVANKHPTWEVVFPVGLPKNDSAGGKHIKELWPQLWPSFSERCYTYWIQAQSWGCGMDSDFAETLSHTQLTTSLPGECQTSAAPRETQELSSVLLGIPTNLFI